MIPWPAVDAWLAQTGADFMIFGLVIIAATLWLTKRRGK